MFSNEEWQRLDQVLELVGRERARQESLKAEGKFPFTCGDKNEAIALVANQAVGDLYKLAVLGEEHGEVARLVCEKAQGHGCSRDKLREELIQVAAVCVAWAESL